MLGVAVPTFVHVNNEWPQKIATCTQSFFYNSNTEMAQSPKNETNGRHTNLATDSPLATDRTCTSRFEVRTWAPVFLASRCSRSPSNSLLCATLSCLRGVSLVRTTVMCM